MTRRAGIGDYGLVGDTRSAALVGPDGSIDWCCLPRFDSAPVFGALVGGEEAGRFAVTPAFATGAPARRYLPQSATLETRWRTDGSQIVLRDTMIAEVAGALLPGTLLVRQVTVYGAPVVLRVLLAPRFGYGRAPVRRAAFRGGALVLEYGDVALALTTNAPLPVLPDREYLIEVPAHQPLTFALSAVRRGPAVVVPVAAARRIADRDELAWRAWCADIPERTAHHDQVVRSLLTLRLLTYSPSGAPVAAPTTSLPEEIGGSRNWDYRYAWPRDASMGVAAFLDAGKPAEAQRFLSWLVHASRTARPRLPAMFDLDGRPAPRERVLVDWPGFSGSAPVRIGNGAGGQHQLDGYGSVLDAAWAYEAQGRRLDRDAWRASAALADHVARAWPLPDAGIWERRDAARHHVHSKLMAWHGLGKAAELAATRGAGAQQRRSRWLVERDAIARRIRAEGFDPASGSYTAAFGTPDLDAAVLLLPVLGFEPPASPRAAGTVAAIRRRLSAGGPLLYRYLAADGLPGREGAFLPCSFWLVQALAVTGAREEAEALFDDLLRLAGPLGLLAEELDPTSGEQLGNYPQALTHAALVQAAGTLANAAPPER